MKGSLAKAVSTVATAGGTPAFSQTPAVPPAPAPEPVVPERPAMRARVAPSREGKVKISVHMPPAARRQLREIALARETSVEEIVRGLVNEMFERAGKPRIA